MDLKGDRVHHLLAAEGFANDKLLRGFQKNPGVFRAGSAFGDDEDIILDKPGTVAVYPYTNSEETLRLGLVMQVIPFLHRVFLFWIPVEEGYLDKVVGDTAKVERLGRSEERRVGKE